MIYMLGLSNLIHKFLNVIFDLPFGSKQNH